VFVACLLGVWRFEIAQPTMPFGLVPFSPKGLAYVQAAGTPADPADVRHWLGVGRQALTTTARQEFPPDQAALLTGMLYGQRDFSQPLREAFRRAGLMHLVAVSGSNVTWLASLAMTACVWLGGSRRRAFVAVSVVLMLFVLFVSPSASVVRAAIMGWLVLLAPIVGRIPRPSRLLLLSAVAFVVWRPWALLFDPGFALSFLAMWGLLTWAPAFAEKLEPRVPWVSVRETVAATLGTTLMTVPYAAWAFGQASWFGIVSNLLVLPLVPWIMLLGMLALLVPWMGWFVWAARGLLEIVLWVAQMAERFPSTGQEVSTTFVGMLGWYLVLWLFWVYLFRKNGVFHSLLPERTLDGSIVRDP
jgi:competence protein ComEC